MKKPEILSNDEFADAQMDFIKKHQEATGITWHFPLQGELRDICNREAQRDKDVVFYGTLIREIIELFIDTLNMRDVGGVEPEWAISNKEYQTLQSQLEEEVKNGENRTSHSSNYNQA